MPEVSLEERAIFKAEKLLKDPESMFWIFEHLDDILENAGLGSMLKRYEKV